MALSKPIPAPYSSFHSNEEGLFDYRVMLNYDLCDEIIQFDRSTLRAILPASFLRLMAGNYRPEPFKIVEAELKRDNPNCWKIKEILDKFAAKCQVLDNYLQNRDRIAVLAQEEGQGSLSLLMYEDMQRLLREIPFFMERNMIPIFTKVNEKNFEMYEPYSFHRFKDRLLALRNFDGLSQCFIHDFFFFSCYALPNERAEIIELAIKRGRELDPQTRRAARREWSAAVCLWIAIEYYDFAKSWPYNARFSSGRIQNRARDTGFMVCFADKMRAIQATEPRARYAVGFLNETYFVSSLPRTRLCDILAHMNPLFALVNECGVAFASCLLTYTRTDKDARGEPVAVTHTAPIAQLGADIIRIIWSYAYDDLSARTDPVEREPEGSSGQRRASRRARKARRASP
jgi:hypothetical protein